MTLEQWQKFWFKTLEGEYTHQESRSLLLMALADRLNWSAIDLVNRKDTELPPREIEWLDSVLIRLNNRTPIQQILGYVWFCNHKFMVTSDVLIPRPETEELVVLLQQRFNKKEIAEALDIGTGSGCIALSMAQSMPQTQWYAWDISARALEVAKRNQKIVKQQVNWQNQDVFQHWPSQTYDLIVSNPPYIPQNELPDMDANVVEHEPHPALFVPDDEPLKFYHRILNQGFVHLNPKGSLYFECHFKFVTLVEIAMHETGFIDIKKWKDQWGKWRFVTGVKP